MSPITRAKKKKKKKKRKTENAKKENVDAESAESKQAQSFRLKKDDAQVHGSGTISTSMSH